MRSSNHADSWDHVSALADDDIPLLRATLMIALDEYPDLDIEAYEARCTDYERQLAPRIEGLDGVQPRLAAINRYLFDELGFSGNQQDYYDPRNSYLNEVLDRKLGIPISLGIIQMELARRLGVPLEGVSFPGHFLVRLPVDGGLLVLDPYHKGRSVDAQELKQRAKPHLGGNDIDDQQLLQILAPASHRAILMRMLRNLKGLYNDREMWDKALRCADRLVRLDAQQADELRDRGQLYMRIGYSAGARADLSRYLQIRPDADDADAVRDMLIEAGGSRARLN
jgi:regulator of sirC expression with transglutaminase-like and TPR domain